MIRQIHHAVPCSCESYAIQYSLPLYGIRDENLTVQKALRAGTWRGPELEVAVTSYCVNSCPVRLFRCRADRVRSEKQTIRLGGSAGFRYRFGLSKRWRAGALVGNSTIDS